MPALVRDWLFRPSLVHQRLYHSLSKPTPVHDGLLRPTVLFLTVGYFDLVHDELYGPRLFLKAIYRHGRLHI